jgi:hypothetical protein
MNSSAFCARALVVIGTVTREAVKIADVHRALNREPAQVSLL